MRVHQARAWGVPRCFLFASKTLKTKKQATIRVLYICCRRFFPGPLRQPTIRFNDTQTEAVFARVQTRMTAITQSLCFSLSPVKMIRTLLGGHQRGGGGSGGGGGGCSVLPSRTSYFRLPLSLCTSRSAGDKSRVGEIKRKKKPGAHHSAGRQDSYLLL